MIQHNGSAERKLLNADGRVVEKRAVIFPLGGPAGGIDVTDTLIDAIATMIGRLSGGNRMLDHLEAEIHLRSLMGIARRN